MVDCVLLNLLLSPAHSVANQNCSSVRVDINGPFRVSFSPFLAVLLVLLLFRQLPRFLPAVPSPHVEGQSVAVLRVRVSKEQRPPFSAAAVSEDTGATGTVNGGGGLRPKGTTGSNVVFFFAAGFVVRLVDFVVVVVVVERVVVARLGFHEFATAHFVRQIVEVGALLELLVPALRGLKLIIVLGELLGHFLDVTGVQWVAGQNALLAPGN